MFKDRLKELRKECGLSQTQLSKALENKVTASAIGLWELGKRIPSLEAVIMIAKYFNVSLDYLAGLED